MLCTNIRNKLKALLRHFDNYVDGHIDIALKITTGLKQVLSSPEADILTAIIPGDADDKLKLKLENALSEAIDVLSIVDSCRQLTDTNSKLQCFVTQLQQKDPQLQGAILQKLAAFIAGRLDDQKLRQNLYDLYTQAKYSSGKV